MDEKTTNPIIDALFQTKAVRVAPQDHPFWYTSGMIGPYYINTHFLFGDEAMADALLEEIERLAAGDRKLFAGQLLKRLRVQYEENETYRLVMDRMLEQASGLTFDFISGGERRDFFFSLLLADLLDKPHLTIFKDGSVFYADKKGFAKSRAPSLPDSKLAGKVALHVADLVTQASSYLRAWLPAVRSVGAVMIDTLVVVDRGQDGGKALAEENVTLSSLAALDDQLFVTATETGILHRTQLEAVCAYHEDPVRYMEKFFQSHPFFLRNEVDSGGKARERALLCVRNGFAGKEYLYS